MADNRGHGALGLKDRIKDFVDLVNASHSDKTVLVELQPIQEVTGWAPDQNGAYIANVDFIFDGVRRDIIDVRSLVDPTLLRVETVQQCRDIPGSFFYDPALVFTPSGAWDDGSTLWDDGVSRWDQFTQLHVHLSDDSDPDDTTIVAVHSFNFAPKGMFNPRFGPTKLINGDMEDWTAGKADNWITVEGTGFTTWDSGASWDTPPLTWDELLQAIFQEQTIVREGKSSMGMTVAPTGITSVEQTLTDEFTPGKIYRFYGAYRTDGDVTPQIRITDGAGTNAIRVDGRYTATAATGHLPLTATGGEWKRFFIDFVAFDTTHTFMLRAIGGTGGGTAYWDNVDVRRVWSYNYHEPRIKMTSIPSTRVGSHDVFFGRKNIGVGSVSLINNDGFFYRLIPLVEWGNQNTVVLWGGEFPPLAPGDLPQEIPLEDYERSFTGLIQEHDEDAEEFKVSLQDLRSFFHSILPLRVYDITSSPDINPAIDGKARPILFGTKENISPGRIEFASNGYGRYEIADTLDAPNGIYGVNAVYAYVDKEAADLVDTNRRIALVFGVDYTEDLAAGNISIINDVGPFEVTAENNIIEWNDGGSIYTAAVPTGLYTATQLAAAIETAMEGVGPSDYIVTYDQAAHTFFFHRAIPVGTFELLTNSGADKDIAIWPLVGFTKGADKTGGDATGYTSDEPVFVDPETNHIIRCDASGYKDNNAGTFTGTGEGPITIGADILRVVLRNYMKKGLDIIDEDSFLDARTNAPEELAIYLGSTISTKDIFDGLEWSNAANIIVNADGVVFYRVNIETITGTVPIVDDKEIQQYGEDRAVADVYQTIRIKYDQDPTTGNYRAAESTDDSVVIRLGRPDTKEFNTFIKNPVDAKTRADGFLVLANKEPRKASMNLLGGRFIRFDVGDKIQVDKSTGVGVDGSIDNVIFRIVSIRKQPQTGKVNVELTDN